MSGRFGGERPARRSPAGLRRVRRAPLEDENAADEWRAYRDVDDDLRVFCPECAERKFGTGGAPD